MSCSYGPGRYDENYEIFGNDYPVGFVRWTLNRNLLAVIKSLSNKSIEVNNLISKSFTIDRAVEAYKLLVNNPNSLGIILNYKSKVINKENSVYFDKKYFNNKSNSGLSFIGAGNYAQKILIPYFKKAKAELDTIVSNDGLDATAVAEKYQFKRVTTDINSLFKDNQSNSIVIATRHDSHAID